MREQINNNPVFQIGLVAVLLVVAGFLLLTSMGGKGEEPAEAETSTATLETPEGAASLTVTTPVAGGEGAAAPSSVAGIAPVPKLRLPQSVRKAIDADRTVVLLIVKRGGLDDSRVRDAVETLSRPGIETFVVSADQTPRYTAITQPVHLERTPALIVVQPRRLSKGLPAASIDYGFRSIASVAQAVADAEYHGHELKYHP